MEPITFKPSSRYLFKSSARYLFKTSSRYLFKPYSRYFFKPISRYLFNLSSRSLFKPSCYAPFKPSSRPSRAFLSVLFYLAFILPAAISLPGCSGASGSSSGAEKPASAGATSPQAAASSGNDASFSYTMDGMNFSGKGTDQFANCAYRSNDGGVNYVLMDITVGQKGIPTQIHIFGADHGVSTFPSSGAAKCSVDMRYSDKDGNQTHSYAPVSLTVTILSNSASRISGTFSGTFDVTGENRTVPLTDGKFDIPYSSYSSKQK
jgi:hypothetical protein